MFKLPELGYEFNALEPHIDAQTMEVHLTKHHATYVDKLNQALEGRDGLLQSPISDLLSTISGLPAELQTPVRNHGGGHHNHSLFWESVKPGGGQMSPEMGAKLQAAFGSIDNFKQQFTDAALGRFGSGWAWLVRHGDQLEVTSTANQDSPLMDGQTPILGLDVWEHAYYLKYQNRRPDYISAWWNVVNWQVVEQRLN